MERKAWRVHFERPTEEGFDTARCALPTYEWLIRDGYTDEEIAGFEVFLRNNAHLLYRFAESGGTSVPSLFKIGGYTVYFWSNENNEHSCARMPGKAVAGCLMADSRWRMCARK